MFRSSKESCQLGVFSSVSSFLFGTSLKAYENGQGWHNLFREYVTLRIKEEIFRPLFCQDDGAPNASIRVLVAMMILKEARGWSDAQLFEECRFNLLVRSALFLPNMDDSIPSESTYYLLRKRIVDWEKAGNDNLMEKVFAQLTQSQAIEFNVNGKNIRMDSKLIGSNIAWYSRYELIHESLRKAYPYIKAAKEGLLLNESDLTLLESINGESGNKVSYRSNKSEIESRMAELGVVIYKIIRKMGNHSSQEIETLCTIFEEQYLENEGSITPRPKEQISAGSIQSPHDTDCHYRDKDGNQVKGFSINVAETCTPANSVNLITNVSVDVASKADCDFLQPAIEGSKEVIIGNIETVNSDGAFHSVDNQDYCKENKIDLILSAIQGRLPRYDLTLNDTGELIVTDLETNEICSSRSVLSRKDASSPKWVIKTAAGKNRYFTQKDIDTCILRKQIENRTKEELNVRNNVEATIFQLGYHYPNDKSRYRGLIKHKMWANARCMWVNFVRIVNFIVRAGLIYVQNIRKVSAIPQLQDFFFKMLLGAGADRIFCPAFPKNRVDASVWKNGFS
jgi:hypothetical protein